MFFNIGKIDRILRFVLGLVLFGLTLTETIGPWGYIGVIPMITALLGFCPAYCILGINTCHLK